MNATYTDEEPSEGRHLDELVVANQHDQWSFDGPLSLVMDGLHWRAMLTPPFKQIEYRGQDAAGFVYDDESGDPRPIARGRIYETRYKQAGDELELYVAPDHGSYDRYTDPL